ncbi:Flavin reductase like domain protein [Sporomusa ovata DSM 2662]|uniref:flavin reductase family protein n=1 Tax=Sporomusa ovata TaxID=2378 RepID=UPI0003882FB1|nr:flavin reductase [Sporomusa ovata]EQB24984.1 flavin reductase-like protein [Sporomusa ovata DSM 2662]
MTSSNVRCISPHKREQVFPLPVVLISTRGKDGVLNLAPWSNITPILRPLDEIILASWIKRDTLTNIRDTGEFVVNIPPASMSEQVMICSRDYPPEVDEFVKANLQPHLSQQVQVPGVEGCLAWLECTLVEEIIRKNYSLVIGKVVNLAVDQQSFNEAGEMDYEKAQPLSAMLGDKGMWFTRPVFGGRYAEYREMFTDKDIAATEK